MYQLPFHFVDSLSCLVSLISSSLLPTSLLGVSNPWLSFLNEFSGHSVLSKSEILSVSLVSEIDFSDDILSTSCPQSIISSDTSISEYSFLSLSACLSIWRWSFAWGFGTSNLSLLALLRFRWTHLGAGSFSTRIGVSSIIESSSGGIRSEIVIQNHCV